MRKWPNATMQMAGPETDKWNKIISQSNSSKNQRFHGLVIQVMDSCSYLILLSFFQSNQYETNSEHLQSRSIKRSWSVSECWFGLDWHHENRLNSAWTWFLIEFNANKNWARLSQEDIDGMRDISGKWQWLLTLSLLQGLKKRTERSLLQNQKWTKAWLKHTGGINKIASSPDCQKLRMFEH